MLAEDGSIGKLLVVFAYVCFLLVKHIGYTDQPDSGFSFLWPHRVEQSTNHRARQEPITKHVRADVKDVNRVVPVTHFFVISAAFASVQT